MASLRRRKVKAGPSEVYGGIAGSSGDRDNDYVCPVCFDTIEEAHMTKCGHSFCYKCIKQSLEKCSRCPKCNYVINKPDQIYPNFTLNELILKFKGKLKDKKRKTDEQAQLSRSGEVQELVPDDLDLANVNYLLELLSHKKQKLEADAEYAESCLLKEFLQQVKDRKKQQLEQLTREITMLDSDSQAVEVPRQQRNMPSI